MQLNVRTTHPKQQSRRGSRKKQEITLLPFCSSNIPPHIFGIFHILDIADESMSGLKVNLLQKGGRKF